MPTRVIAPSVASRRATPKSAIFTTLPVGGQQKILRFDVAMDHAALVRVGQAGTDLFEIEERLLDRQRVMARERQTCRRPADIRARCSEKWCRRDR